MTRGVHTPEGCPARPLSWRVRRRVVGVALLLGVGAPLAAPGAEKQVTETRELVETFPLAADGLLVVDNLHGSIRVTGTSGSEVHMRAVETIEADDREALDLARREVSLETRTLDGLVDLWVDGPFRDRSSRDRDSHDGDSRDGWSWKRWSHRPYRVRYDFTLEVPAGADLRVRTVNDGGIVVDGVHGDFEVSNVNGGIEMLDARGSGSLSTMNGPIRATFSRGPAADSRFETVNGEVEVRFPGDLSAELALDTRFGEIWSEFDFVSMPVVTTQETTPEGKTIIRMGGPVVRVAAGGPRLSFETLNGDVLIRRHAER